MAITQAVCTSFKRELLTGLHDFTFTTGHVFKMALYTSIANLDASTTVYTSTDEVTGAGYNPGGNTLVNVTPTISGSLALTDFGDTTWPLSEITARGGLIYNSTSANRAVAVLDFGSDKKSEVGSFTVTFPPADITNAIIRVRMIIEEPGMVAYVKYEIFIEHFCNKLIDYFGTGDIWRVIIHTDDPVVATDDDLSDFVEIAGTNGYISGGEDINFTSSRSGAVVTSTASDVVWIAAGGDLGGATDGRYFTVYDNTSTGNFASHYYDYGATFTVASGETMTLDFGLVMATMT